MGRSFVIKHNIECVKAEIGKRIGDYESIGDLVTWKRERKITPQKEFFNSAELRKIIQIYLKNINQSQIVSRQ